MVWWGSKGKESVFSRKLRSDQNWDSDDCKTFSTRTNLSGRITNKKMFLNSRSLSKKPETTVAHQFVLNISRAIWNNSLTFNTPWLTESWLHDWLRSGIWPCPPVQVSATEVSWSFSTAVWPTSSFCPGPCSTWSFPSARSCPGPAATTTGTQVTRVCLLHSCNSPEGGRWPELSGDNELTFPHLQCLTCCETTAQVFQEIDIQ